MERFVVLDEVICHGTVLAAIYRQFRKMRQLKTSILQYTEACGRFLGFHPRGLRGDES